MTTLNDIPFGYLVNWASTNKAYHPELSYLSTLNKKKLFSEADKWGSISPRLPLSKPSQKLTDALAKCETILIRDFDEDNGTIVLPADAKQYTGFYEMVKAFISEYLQELNRALSLPETKYADSLDKKITVFRETFEFRPFHESPTSRAQLALLTKLKTQMVDNYLRDLSADCKSCLSGDKVGRVVADPALVSEFSVFRKKMGVMVSQETFRKAAGIDPYDGRTQEFLASVLGLVISKSTEGIIPVVASKGLLKQSQRQLGEIISYFRKEVIGIRTEVELEAELNGIKDRSMIEAFRSFILSSEEFVRYTDNGEECVTLRWDFLQTYSARVCWILYELQAFDYKSAVTTEELLKKYNVLAKQNGVSTITANQLALADRSGECHKAMLIGRSGFWKIRRNPAEVYDFDDFIRKYMRKHGTTVDLDAFLDVIKADGQYRFYKNERTIRSRLTMNGATIAKHPKKTTPPAVPRKVARLTVKERDKRWDHIVSILDRSIDSFTIKELYDIFEKTYPGTHYSTFSLWVSTLISQGRINAIIGTGRTPTYVSSKAVKTVAK